MNNLIKLIKICLCVPLVESCVFANQVKYCPTDKDSRQWLEKLGHADVE
jgi:hypothetical protein